MNVIVDQDICIGCELCTQVCGEVFAMREDGNSHVIEGADVEAACVEEAIVQCPVSCIHRQG